MTRFPSLSFLCAMLAISAAPARASECEDNPDYPFAEEWATLSENGTRAVYNFGIASLLNHASEQFQLNNYTWPSNRSISEKTMTYVTGIRREIRGCWRYHSAKAVECEPGDSFCPPMLGAYFEVKEEDWKALRTRECSYNKFVKATPIDENAPEGNYFAWGRIPGTPCNPDYDDFPDVISQAYFDSTIGGILAWDGMLADTGRFTWDVGAELELGSETMAGLVARAPSLSWEDRYNLAVEFVRSTAYSPDLPWMDDRRCPFTGDGGHLMTPVAMLDYRHAAVYDGTCPKAIGGAAPLASPEFYDLIDQILIEGGWGSYGANNTIDERYDPCDEAARQKITRRRFDPNEYYNDVVEWREANNLPIVVTSACDEDAATPADTTSTNGNGEHDRRDDQDSHDHDHDHSSEEDSGALAVEGMLYATTAAVMGSVLFLL